MAEMPANHTGNLRKVDLKSTSWRDAKAVIYSILTGDKTHWGSDIVYVTLQMAELGSEPTAVSRSVWLAGMAGEQ